MFEAEARCYCGAEIEQSFEESHSISEYSLSPVVQQSTYWMDQEGSVYCNIPDPEGTGPFEHSVKEYIDV